ncbi:hypothetical protein [Nitratidesulfovibrio vulgaris]|uniref:Uncharacterized protein n=1 Tax=Nitratidesulfovibrio vulgaris (strain ATCC 29579 / DSM 644 / CCUG 34227 / NCIMB 8303 / VKM B-1760 / Hildenborough) TaxID=882 RepID=Q72BX2_NITV2|nr:hypothetical protein [Nitratidesulfovibrio vulgaris]AAS95990.1 hypothetical protein DVU_1512 [Nitratidesulfovibrio vulgaris str. Hildenborough]ADP86933.1 hypothetical protein Deval_1782 [Nitratidesulfovibrio vulgaris RCH1]WCB45056.1 hypothetical protein PH214_08095 [Nitratidesulfovibrio vulgaris]GEB79239.1 hypothetical protein DDE01_06540 [Desulfovibrio desulfuricans]
MSGSSHPEWATAKVRVYFATCWYGIEGEQHGPSLLGVRWWDDHLLTACTWFHNYFVQPFFPDEGFPIRVVETYEGFDVAAFMEGGR